MKNRAKCLFYIILCICAIPQIIYRFHHPEMTETQLFINFFQAYKEIIR